MTFFPRFLRLAVAAPLQGYFDYLPPQGVAIADLLPGIRLRVPFGPSKRIALLLGLVEHSAVPLERLKVACEILDIEPLLTGEEIGLLQWASRYYHYPLGDVIFSALPASLRKGFSVQEPVETYWRLSQQGNQQDPNTLQRAPRQAALLRILAAHPQGISSLQAKGQKKILEALLAKGWVESHQRVWSPFPPPTNSTIAPSLNKEQLQAVQAVESWIPPDKHAPGKAFRSFLLEGVTGSGKTEVYLHLSSIAIARGRQVLLLVPEIGLTPQLIERFQHRLMSLLVVSHSKLSDTERLNAWTLCRTGKASVIIGTRSAIFTPLPQLGLILVDEEHDASFKQQEGFRYSARDIAIMRAKRAEIPIVLGTATPALESVKNATRKGYKTLYLKQRAGQALPPFLRILDIRNRKLVAGISKTLLKSITKHLARGEQVMLFLNRRGYAPVLMCYQCGWMAACPQCDARMTLHQENNQLICHHCGGMRTPFQQCPSCKNPDLSPQGEGTERIEQALKNYFPNTGIVRFDRDSIRVKGDLEERLALVRSGRGQLLIGTQMLAKGHDFPNITLVGILNMDHGFFSVDFRAGERMAQLIVQVAGRAGRAEKPGLVVLQTRQPDHPLLQKLIYDGYPAFAKEALEERRATGFPPFSAQALVRAEASVQTSPLAFLSEASTCGPNPENQVQILGPVPAPMKRRQGRYRYQLLLQADQRADLQRYLRSWLPLIAKLPAARRVRWSLDVDPVELF